MMAAAEKIDALIRFHDLIVYKGIGCWLWSGSVDERSGYPRFWYRGKNKRAHRWYWEIVRGRKLELGEQLDHMCCNTSCVKPVHLTIVTDLENQRRRRYRVMGRRKKRSKKK